MIVAQEGRAGLNVESAQEVCQKDEAIVQHAQDRKVLSVVSVSNLPGKLFNSRSDFRRAVNLYDLICHHSPRFQSKVANKTENRLARSAAASQKLIVGERA